MEMNKEKLTKIKGLQAICEADGDFQLKLNIEMLTNRSDDLVEDFFHYDGDVLVGFLGMYGFGKTLEICGMVHPDYRRQGIFKGLFNDMLKQAAGRNFQEILLNCPATSVSGSAFIKSLQSSYSFSEYQMKWSEGGSVSNQDVQLIRSNVKEDLELKILLYQKCFGLSEEEARLINTQRKESLHEQMYKIQWTGQPVGIIRLSTFNGEFWIYGFSVLPEFQGRGIGRAALSQAVALGTEAGMPIYLEVAAANSQALGLYESCGFKSLQTQDYYCLEKF